MLARTETARRRSRLSSVVLSVGAPGKRSLGSWVCGSVAGRRVGAGDTDLGVLGVGSLTWTSSPTGSGSLKREEDPGATPAPRR